MKDMRPFRAFGPRFRIVLAVLFGFMSLAHGPVMAFAQDKVPQTIHQPVAKHAAQHAQHGNHAQKPAQNAEPAGHQHTSSICYASGCFTAVAPILLDAPATLLALLQQLRPGAGHLMVPADIDPSDPPPRLQA